MQHLRHAENRRARVSALPVAGLAFAALDQALVIGAGGLLALLGLLG